jgi:hypothetical protein
MADPTDKSTSRLLEQLGNLALVHSSFKLFVRPWSFLKTYLSVAGYLDATMERFYLGAI